MGTENEMELSDPSGLKFRSKGIQSALGKGQFLLVHSAASANQHWGRPAYISFRRKRSMHPSLVSSVSSQCFSTEESRRNAFFLYNTEECVGRPWVRRLFSSHLLYWLEREISGMIWWIGLGILKTNIYKSINDINLFYWLVIFSISFYLEYRDLRLLWGLSSPLLSLMWGRCWIFIDSIRIQRFPRKSCIFLFSMYRPRLFRCFSR